MAGRIPSRGSDQFNLRFPDGMRDQLKVEAEKSGRSLNAEIIHRLESTLQPASFSLNISDGADSEPYLPNATRQEIIKDIELSFRRINFSMDVLKGIAENVMDKVNKPGDKD